ncbi:hypothetical protein PIB30_085347 [Stylosanthes scabra]|uniref:Uncharacterized protein n=1 Tax=Stylosanthes scabra TaxID=79078 RepID=A0ABU6ZRH5_9FABA|nr:hypothetical protein [Stylosanthes scabra]
MKRSHPNLNHPLLYKQGATPPQEGLFVSRSLAKASKRADSGDEALERRGGGPARPLRRSSQ